jgi:glycosyltransferase involved in cell wall biosynthesis
MEQSRQSTISGKGGKRWCDAAGMVREVLVALVLGDAPHRNVPESDPMLQAPDFNVLYPGHRFGLGRTQHGPWRVGLVGTFPPRQCGLATFTADVAASLVAAGDEVVVAALVDTVGPAVPGVSYQLLQTSEESARTVARSLSTEVDVVLIQHEFGIFGGENSAVLLALTDNLTIPYVITLHTVLEHFRDWQTTALEDALAGAAMVFVFSEAAVELIAAQFAGVEAKCRVVPHAAPTSMFLDPPSGLRDTLGLSEHTMVMSTFRLLSPSKGIEHVIRAMPTLRRRLGDVVYLIAGRTHPEVVCREGEQYRDALRALSRSLGVDDVVRFRDWFHDVDELSALLHASDVFVTPYSDAEQIVSGALSFALAAGVPFVSTPYRYATGLAAQGCGLTVPFNDDDALADVLARVLGDDGLRHRMAARAAAVSTARSWPQVGQLIHSQLDGVIEERWAARTVDRQLAGTIVDTAVS